MLQLWNMALFRKLLVDVDAVGFDELMPKTIANPTVDRLLHHAHIVMTTGDSIRLTQATHRQGGDAPRPMIPGSSTGHPRAEPTDQ